LRRKPDAVKLALVGRQPQTQAVISRTAVTDIAQEADLVKLAMEGKEPQAQAVMSRQSGTDD
jgi:hypothetical protein